MTKAVLQLLKNNCIRISLAACIVLLPSVAFAATYYVSPNGSDGAPGSQSQPWKTIDYAVSRVSSGDVVRVADGTYHLADRIAVPAGVTLIAIGDGAVIDCSGVPSSRASSIGLWADNVTLEGFDIRNAPRRCIGLSGSNVTIRGCRLHDNIDNAIFVSGAQSCTITENEIDHNGIVQDRHGVYVERNVDDLWLTDNVVHHNGETGLKCNGNDGTVSTHIRIHRNIIYANGAKAANFQNVHDSEFMNNVCFGNNADGQGAGVFTMGSDTDDENGNFVPGTGALRNVIANNTIVSSNMGTGILLNAADPRGGLGADDCVVFNNIVITTRTNGIINNGINNQIDHNYTNRYGSSVLNAMFENYQANDYRILPGSPAEGAAVTSYAGKSAPSVDITGNPRALPYDLGAYELGVPGPTYVVNTSTQGSGSVTKNPDKAEYEAGESLTLTASASAGWVFSSWSGDASGTQNPLNITVTGNMSVTAVFTEIPQEYNLNVSVQGNGSVAKSPDKATYTSGEQVTLTATPEVGWTFSNWSGDLSGSTNPITTTITGDMTVTAVFDALPPEEYTVATSVQGNGSVAKSPDKATYTSGEQVTLTASPDPGWVFSNWTGGLSGSVNPITTTVTADISVTAVFNPIPPEEYAVNTSVQGSGTVTKNPDKATYVDGEQVTLTATADPGWVFANWSGDLGGSINPITTTVTADISVTAVFDPIPPEEYAVTTSVQGDGSIAKNPDKSTYLAGEQVTFTAVPSSGWQFSNWSGDLSGGANPITTTIGSDMSVTAVFTAIPDPPPAQPSGVAAVEPGSDRVRVSWNANGEGDLAGYELSIGSIPGNYDATIDVGLATSRDLFGITGRYYFAVRAYDVANNYSAYSSEATIYAVGTTPTNAFRVARWSFDEGVGTTVADSWGSNDGSLANGASWEPAGAVNTAARFDGVNDYTHLGGVDVADGPGFTAAMWIKADDFGVPDARFITKATDTAEQSHYWMLSTIQQTGLRFRLRADGVTTTLLTAAGQLQVGQWYHVAATYDGAEMRIYKDGVLVASTPKTGVLDVNAGVAAAIGNQPSGAGNLPFDGVIDDVLVYRRALSASEIATLMDARTNASPVASLSANPPTGIAPLTVSFDASASSDPEDDPLTYSWDFGDGANGSGVTVDHTYTLAGTYDAVLTVADDKGNEDSEQVTINVGEQTTPPTIPVVHLVTEDSPGCVLAVWSPNSELDLAGYILYYGTKSVEGGEAATYDNLVTLGAVTSWQGCSFDQGTYYFSVRARNTSGQLSGYSDEVAVDVDGPDVVSPFIIPLAPTDGATGVGWNEQVRFVVLDDRTGVDRDNMTVRIDGTAPGSMQFDPENVGYTVTCTPAASYPPGSSIVVEVTASDLATPANSTTETWSFTTIPAAPQAPTGLAAVGSDSGFVDLSWNANPEGDIAGYKIFYGTRSGMYSDSVSVGLVTSRRIGGLAADTYYFALKARNDFGLQSGYSAEASAVVTNAVVEGPEPPQDVQVSETNPGCMMVTWQASDNPDVSGYTVFYGTESVAEGKSSAYFNSIEVSGSTSREICKLPTNTYYVAVKAFTAQGQYSSYSTEKNVDVTAPDQMPPTITLAYPADGAVDIPQNAKVFLILTDDQAGLDTASVDVRIGNVAPASIEYSGDGMRLGAVCELAQPLPANSVISVDVSVSDLAVPANVQTQSWSFTTGDAADDTPPVFVTFTPRDGAEGVAPDADVVVEIVDDGAIDLLSVQLFVEGEEADIDVVVDNEGRVTVTRQKTTPLPHGDVDVRVVVFDAVGNRAELLFDFTVESPFDNMASAQGAGAIVPDGFWADDPDRPLEVRNLPVGWTVRIFTASGVQVRAFENSEDAGMTWTWDFTNDHGQEVARAIYLVRVVDGNGNVQRSGKFVVRNDR